jgi:nucleoside diphosphate kinase
VLINKQDTFIDENGIKTFYQSPIVRWKELIGLKDPVQAKANNPDSLRAIYGTDIIKNEFWGSDTPSDAYRELCNFMMPLPSRVL